MFQNTKPSAANPVGSYLAVLVLLVTLGACNHYNVEPLDQILNASNRIENRLPAKTKLDFLFVIDDSSSMGEEQKALAENFKTFSDFLFDELQGAADYRIAVTNSGVVNEAANCTEEKAASGKFLYKPANEGIIISLPEVLINGEPPESRVGVFPDTADCGESEVVISSETLQSLPVNQLPPAPAGNPFCEVPDSAACIKVRRKLYLEKEFRCHSTLGTSGCVIEKGLEAMRLALSCSGPNAEMFKSCCVDYNENDPNQNKYSYYNPACTIGPNDEEPSFLRPDATLVIIFISDENDCSTPVDNPTASSRFICQPGWNLDMNQDNIPDIYEGRCGLDPAECFRRECGDFATQGAEVCHNKRCDVERYQDLGCEYNRRQALVPVNEYRDFLLKLKVRPLDQILVATIVGFRQYLRDELNDLVLNPSNDEPYELVYNPGIPAENCDESVNPNVYTPECCPNGNCKVDSIKHSCNVSTPRAVECAALNGDDPECQNFCGDEAMSCDLVVIDQNIATPGSRYLELADSLGANGLGCSQGNEPIIDPITGVIEERGECVNICVDDFIKPLRAIKDRVADLLNTYCVNRLPACYAPDVDGSLRLCEGEELSNATYYKSGIRISRQCLVTREQGGNCDAVEPLTTLPESEWSFSLGTEGCAGIVELLSIPPAGSEIFIDYIVTAGESTSDGESLEETDIMNMQAEEMPAESEMNNEADMFMP